jgi:hypothetical protein
MTKTVPFLVVASWLVLAGAVAAQQAPQAKAGALLGSWTGLSNTKRSLVHFDEKKCFLYEDNRLQVFAASYDADKVILRSLGRSMVWKVRFETAMLTLASADGQMQLRFRKLAQMPAELEPRPLALGKPMALPEEKVRRIQEELAKRLVEDQAVRKEAPRFKDMPRVDADNTAYLTRLTQELGWIDAARFGPEAANAAFLIAQHSGDLPLMLAALPGIETDMKARRVDAQYYALLYDRLQLLLGEKQKYGTQLGQNDRGEMVILPIANRERLEELRRELGLMPFAQYLSLYKQNHGLKEVKFADD